MSSGPPLAASRAARRRTALVSGLRSLPTLPAVLFPFSLLQRYGQFERDTLALLDDLAAARPLDPRWESTPMRRRIARDVARLSASERLGLRDLAWRYRGWRGLAGLGAIAAAASAVGLLLHWVWPERLGLTEMLLLVNFGVFSLGLGIVSAWFNPGRLATMKPAMLWRLLVLAAVGALVGAAIAGLVQGKAPMQVMRQLHDKAPALLAAGVLAGGAYLGALALLVTWRNRELRRANEALAAQAEQARLGRQLAASQLRLLQAQIEPHFLFNTLGAVQQAAEAGAPEAAALVAHLVAFLRHVTASFRGGSARLGDELAVVESYLRIMQSRLGPRLRFAVEAPAALQAAVLLPTLLLTLVENAVKHGIEPAPGGGEVRVSAAEDAGQLVIDVADTGLGMAELPGQGVGLANLREQLALAHGDAAALELFDNEPQGLVARLRLPMEGPR